MSDLHPHDDPAAHRADTARRRHRLAFVAIALAAIGGLVAAIVAAVDDPEPEQIAIAPAAAALDDADGAEGADDAADEAAEADEEPAQRSADAAIAPAVAETMPVECVDGEIEEYVPSAEEIAQANQDTETLVAVLTAAGIEHEVRTDDLGFSWVDFDYEDAVAQAVANSHYRAMYPDEFGFEEKYEIPEEELARIQEENAGLIEVLEAAGIAYEVVSDEGGYEWVEFDYEDPAAQEVVDAYYLELYPVEPIPEEELARIREENAGLIAALDEAGITYEVIAEEGGYEWVEWDYEDPAAQEAVDGYYAELYGDDYVGGECEFGGVGEEWIPTEQDLAYAEEEVAAMSAVLDAAGVEYTIQEDDNGWRWVEWDYEDPAAQEAVDGYYEAQMADQNAAANARLDELAAAFDAAGVSYEREGHDDCPTIIFDTTDDAAMAVVATLVAAD